MIGRLALPLGLAVGAAPAAVACSSVPDVTYGDAGGAAPGASSSTTSSSSSSSGGADAASDAATGTDASTSGSTGTCTPACTATEKCCKNPGGKWICYQNACP